MAKGCVIVLYNQLRGPTFLETKAYPLPSKKTGRLLRKLPWFLSIVQLLSTSLDASLRDYGQVHQCFWGKVPSTLIQLPWMSNLLQCSLLQLWNVTPTLSFPRASWSAIPSTTRQVILNNFLLDVWNCPFLAPSNLYTTCCNFFDGSLSIEESFLHTCIWSLDCCKLKAPGSLCG